MSRPEKAEGNHTYADYDLLLMTNCRYLASNLPAATGMSHPVFHFKQFSIRQDRCAMKVSTDACLQGALTPVNAARMHRVLDIGAGTGLLSLMLAQRLPDAVFDAIEIDRDAAAQAEENVSASPFLQRIRVIHADAAAWPAVPYDLIICNPPFFNNSLQGPDAARNKARHVSSLDGAALCGIISKHMARSGAASLMWPPAEHERFAAEAQKAGLHPAQLIEVRDKMPSSVKRIISTWTLEKSAEMVTRRFVLKADSGQYSAEAIEALSPFYLRL